MSKFRLFLPGIGLVFSIVCITIICGMVSAGIARAQQPAIPPGTVITHSNWQQYKQFMPDGMQQMFAGTVFWKFPPDFQIVMGPPHHYPPPTTYVANTEKYASQVKIVNLSDGGHSLNGYVAGLPFPNPGPPLKGWKVLVNEWYRYVPWIICSSPPGYQLRLKDRFGGIYTERTALVYRRMSHISDYDKPITDPQAQGIDYSEWVQLTAPEQNKYVTNLTLYYDDLTKPEDVFLFIPALRRSLRLSASARCAPFVGTDWTQDDVRSGFNGGIVRWVVKYLHDQQIVTLTSGDPAVYGKWENYYPTLLFVKPTVGQWELRPVYVIDVRRVPSQRAGYCYGKQIMYIDQKNYNLLWKEMYDASMKLWKNLVAIHIASPVPREGIQAETGNFIQAVYDQQNDHMSIAITADEHGQYDVNNSACKSYDGINYTNVELYSSVAGLSEVLR